MVWFRIANVILQSGFTVPDWMLKLPKPSKMKRKQMGKVKRPEMVNPARFVGRRDAVKKRYVFCITGGLIYITVPFHSNMILGSKRRAAKVSQPDDKLDES